jgi:hypothetical protein
MWAIAVACKLIQAVPKEMLKIDFTFKQNSLIGLAHP